MKNFTLLTLLLLCINVCRADLRSWALSFPTGQDSSAIIHGQSTAKPNEAVKTCVVQGLSPHKHVHSEVWFSSTCSGSGWWRMEYGTDEGRCIMFGDIEQTGCPFASFWTSKAQVIGKNRGNGEEYTDKGITFVGCEKGATVEVSRDEDRYCEGNAPADDCKSMLIFKFMSFLCPKK
ncbi:uncharacterized protein B0P05DRAFT_521124 [Gilbertella persicaria]|uniref:uncharacterized protein n=1 Tax=Gilbertella persicaria TaxID=101096 RepID=UPI00221ED3E8|nr:uncharacterized protein B0P05DRAFT_521124 [Gilbertella persicaria]KAI8098262.1 hypothetical protein B0P05DRAFT_521124 [Gilbertella persicaria]